MREEKPFFRNIIGPDAEGWTVLRFYTEKYPYATEEAWTAWIDEGRVELRGRKARPGDLIRTGDILIFFRGERDEPRVDTGYRIVFEDAHVVVVDKPGGLPVMPSGPYFRNTLLHMLRAGRKGTQVHPAHRIDIETSGLVVFTKTLEAARLLARSFRDRHILKEYEAVLRGHLEEEVTVEAPTGRVKRPGSRNTYGVTASGKRAVTVFSPIDFFAGRRLTLVKAVPETGRTHQVRIHAAHIGLPILGDAVHGVKGVSPDGGSGSSNRPRSRLALHASVIVIPHPEGKRRFEAPAPAWFREGGPPVPGGEREMKGGKKRA